MQSVAPEHPVTAPSLVRLPIDAIISVSAYTHIRIYVCVCVIVTARAPAQDTAILPTFPCAPPLIAELLNAPRAGLVATRGNTV